jgi:hypothetical protein
MTLLIFFTSSFANFSNSRTFWTFSIAHTKEKAWIVTLTQTNACGREEIALLQADGRVLRRGYVPRLYVRVPVRTIKCPNKIRSETEPPPRKGCL